MKKVKSSARKYLKTSFVILAAASTGAFYVGDARAADDLAQSEWFQTKCQPSLERYLADRSFIESSETMGVWASPMTDQLPWPNAFRSQYARHACISMNVKYMNTEDARTERVLCSVLDNDLPTEVTVFGNEGIAAEICAEPS